MNIPTIGGPRGIFEVFVPGMFLLLNTSAAVYSNSLMRKKGRSKTRKHSFNLSPLT